MNKIVQDYLDAVASTLAHGKATQADVARYAVTLLQNEITAVAEPDCKKLSIWLNSDSQTYDDVNESLIDACKRFNLNREDYEFYIIVN